MIKNLLTTLQVPRQQQKGSDLTEQERQSVINKKENMTKCQNHLMLLTNASLSAEFQFRLPSSS